MPNINPSLKPFVINNTDIQFLLDQVNFTPLFKANGDIIVAWDGTGTVYDFFGNVLAIGGSSAADPASINAIAAVGSSYQNYTDLSGTRDVSGFWNNLTPLLSHYGDTGFVFPRMVGANYTNYLVQATGSPETGNTVITFTPIEITSDLGTPTAIYDNAHLNGDPNGAYIGEPTVFFGPGFTKYVHEIVSVGTATDTTTATTTSTQVTDGHHLVVTATTTTVDTTTTTSTYDYTKDETTTTLTTAHGSSSDTSQGCSTLSTVRCMRG